MSTEQKTSPLIKHVFIYAENYKMAADFAKMNSLHILMSWTFLHSAEQLKGHKDIFYIRLGDCYDVAKKQEIELELKARNDKEGRFLGLDRII